MQHGIFDTTPRRGGCRAAFFSALASGLAVLLCGLAGAIAAGICALLVGF